MRDKVGHVGFVIHKITRENGLVEWRFQLNTITTVGLQRMASHHASDSVSKTLFTHLAFGDGTEEAESEDNAALENQIYIEALDNVFAAGVTIFGSLSIVATDIGGDTYDIAEVGLFDAASGGNLIARQLLDTVIEDLTGSDRIDTLWGIVNQ